MRQRIILFATALSLCVLSACSSSSTTARPALPTGKALFRSIVGIGDSLTAGEQSGGLLGATGVTSPVSGFPNNIVPPGQENGFWSLLYQQATGTPAAAMYNPATSPLPLIAGPGLFAQLVLTSTGSFAATHSPCDAFNNAAFASSSPTTVRLNPSTLPLDLGVPGATVHEALFMVAPLTGPPTGPGCSYPLSPADPSTALQPVVSGESEAFYPILGTLARNVEPLTQVGAAVSLHPSLVTVWLGANDLLKYIFSGGRAPSDTPAQMQADISAILRDLHAAGARVVVANLPNVLQTPQFFQGGSTLIATLEAAPFNVPAAAASAVAGYLQTTYGVGPNGYLTETGFFKVVAALQGGSVTPVLSAPGDFLTDAFAAQVEALNDAYNAAIGTAARATDTPLVDIHGLFAAIASAGGIPINPPYCCSLRFGGGLLSLDGLHPSNTGYAIIANAFIQTIDAAFGTNVPQLTSAQLLAISQTDPYAPPGGFARLLTARFRTANRR